MHQDIAMLEPLDFFFMPLKKFYYLLVFHQIGLKDMGLS